MGNLILFSGWDNEYMNWVGDTSKIKEMIECLLGGGNSNICLFSSLFGEDEPKLTIIFLRWVESTNQLFCFQTTQTSSQAN